MSSIVESRIWAEVLRDEMLQLHPAMEGMRINFPFSFFFSFS